MPVLPRSNATANGSAAAGALVLRHLDAAYTLARWLLGDAQDAADTVHDAFLRATTSPGSRDGGNPRAWWLAIVRNCCFARLAARGRDGRNVALDQIAHEHGREAAEAWLPTAEADALEQRIETMQRSAMLARHLRTLPPEFREVLVLRELEELSYREIADVLQRPIGTVMSRLARGRAMLQQAVNAANEVEHGM
jgi:RNA polymerase sigma-70 factor, ECF subfamily